MKTSDILEYVPIFFFGLEFEKYCEPREFASDAEREDCKWIRTSFPNPKLWKRAEKRRSDACAPDDYHPTPELYSVDWGDLSGHNEILYDKCLKVWVDSGYKKNPKLYYPWMRTFIIDTSKLDTTQDYRLEVFTTPDDSEIISWVLITD